MNDDLIVFLHAEDEVQGYRGLLGLVLDRHLLWMRYRNLDHLTIGNHCRLQRRRFLWFEGMMM
jgi:hypothetical protein